MWVLFFLLSFLLFALSLLILFVDVGSWLLLAWHFFGELRRAFFSRCACSECYPGITFCVDKNVNLNDLGIGRGGLGEASVNRKIKDISSWVLVLLILL